MRVGHMQPYAAYCTGFSSLFFSRSATAKVDCSSALVLPCFADSCTAADACVLSECMHPASADAHFGRPEPAQLHYQDRQVRKGQPCHTCNTTYRVLGEADARVKRLSVSIDFGLLSPTCSLA